MANESGDDHSSQPASTDGLDFAKFELSLHGMPEAELFRLMKTLEEQALVAVQDNADDSELFAMIEMVETQVEKRHPGQAMMPYKQWRETRGKS